ncbi:MAG: TraR/DksA C4-type zinc finger protein [Micrococcales bacterium]|nr:TraR/DksA C4-type zinc finger protein [Micrococcales bacterium]
MARVGDGWNGRCTRCDQPIPPERLAARPCADRCIRCAVAGSGR